MFHWWMMMDLYKCVTNSQQETAAEKSSDAADCGSQVESKHLCV